MASVREATRVSGSSKRARIDKTCSQTGNIISVSDSTADAPTWKCTALIAAEHPRAGTKAKRKTPVGRIPDSDFQSDALGMGVPRSSVPNKQG